MRFWARFFLPAASEAEPFSGAVATKFIFNKVSIANVGGGGVRQRKF